MIFADTGQPDSRKMNDDTIRDFHSAVAAGDRRAVESMLKNWSELSSARLPDPEPARQIIPVFTAIDHGQVDVLSVLLKAGSPCFNDLTQQTALDRATVFGTEAVVKTLIEAGENVDGLTDPSDVQELDRLSRGTPLRDAISCGHIESAYVLVQHGAHIDICSAAGLGWTGWVTRRLKEHADEADVADDWRYTPLNYAVAGGCSGTAEVLLSHGADVTRTYDDGGTLLQQATAHGHHDLMAVLLAHGADVNAKNKAGDTALDFALRYNQPDAADLLREHGGRRGAELAN